MMVGSRDKLQSETGYIDARPHPPDRRNLLQRTAGPYIGSCVDGAHGSRYFFGFLLAVGCKSCVRPVCSVLMTAGPDVIRRSGPYTTPALDSARTNNGFSRSTVQ